MPRQKKNGVYLNVCIDKELYDSFSQLCDEAGQTKTIAVERAIKAYLDDYNLTKERLLTFQSLERKIAPNGGEV